jgi:hypothetical protein
MSICLSIEKQNPYIDSSTYHCFAPFVSQTSVRPPGPNKFSPVFAFLGLEDLGCSEKVCRTWQQFIYATQWKSQCQVQLGFSPKMDPKQYLPNPSYKKSLQLIFSDILGKSVYEHHLGKVGPGPSIPKEIFLNWKKEDPCDPKKMIGKEYVLMYVPDYIEVTHLDGFSLDKPDNPNDPEAPKLIKKEGFIDRCAKTVGLGAKSKNKVLKIPMTINNIIELFKHPKPGKPSTYSYIWENITEQHGNKRIPAEWIYIRRCPVGRNLPFLQQEELAKEKKVIISSLQHRILFNFLEYVRIGIYPDGQHPLTYVHTSTRTLDSQGNDWPSGCGGGEASSGLLIYPLPLNEQVSVGMSVALSNAQLRIAKTG